jgi:hypothetical protein
MSEKKKDMPTIMTNDGVEKNFQQVDDLWELIANRYEKLVEAQDRLLQANLQLQKEMVTVASRVLRLEKKEREQKKNQP